jgi:hypothetical protein
MIFNLNLTKCEFFLSKKAFVDVVAPLNWQNPPQEGKLIK